MDQDREIRAEAGRQYFKYFRIWIIAVVILLAAAITVTVVRHAANNKPRGNQDVPQERVYDYANVLTDAEEEQLREYIARLEKEAHADLVLVTIDQAVGLDDRTWETNMMNMADDLYENVSNAYDSYGWDKPYGDGALLLDNWYEDENGSQKGSWLSTSGKMERIIGAYQEGCVFDAMDVYIDSEPYRAYEAALEKLAEYGSGSGSDGGDWAAGEFGILVVSAIVALIYALCNLRQPKAQKTTNPATYVVNGKPDVRFAADDFLRKSVTKHRIQTSSGGGGSRSGGGGGGSFGSHSSSSGHSHGGGGRRR